MGEKIFILESPQEGRHVGTLMPPASMWKTDRQEDGGSLADGGGRL